MAQMILPSSQTRYAGEMKLLCAAIFSLLVVIPARSDDTPLDLTRGGIVLTFDDRNFDHWIAALPLFEKYAVHATFFISGKIDGKALETAQQLIDHGHAIGAHSVNHVRATGYFENHTAEEYLHGEISPQLDAFKAAGIPVSSFAYPMSDCNRATDEVLLKIFRHLRSGKGIDSGKMITDYDDFFTAIEKVGERGQLPGKGIDFAPTRPDRTFEQIDGALARAANNKEIVTLYAHQITHLGKGNFITPAALEHIFQTARKLELPFYTFDQLP